MIFLPDQNDLEAIFLTLKLSGISTIILLVISLPLAWWMSLKRSMLRSILEPLFCLPVILPPSVLGFYLLSSFGTHGIIGRFISLFGGQTLAFSFTGLIFGSVLYSLPFVIQPLQNSIESVDPQLIETGSLLGLSPVKNFLFVTIPMIKNGIITSFIMGFAHTMGEFGVVLMIGGNIPGETRVISIAIYDHVEAMSLDKAHNLSLIMLIFSFLVLIFISVLNKGNLRGKVR